MALDHGYLSIARSSKCVILVFDFIVIRILVVSNELGCALCRLKRP